MRAAFVADVHVGNHSMLAGERSGGLNERAYMVLNALIDACVAAQKSGCTDLVVLGDLFDTHRASPQMVASVARALSFFPGRKHLLLGNHDAASDERGDNALAPLAHVQGIHVWDEPDVFFAEERALAFIPFQSGDAAAWLPGAFEVVKQKLAEVHALPTAVCIHLGVRDLARGGPPWSFQAHDAVDVDVLQHLCQQIGANAAFAGNWHVRDVWKAPPVDVVQVGSLCPTGWDNPGMDGYGGVEFWDGDWLERARHEVAGPRFVGRVPAEPDPKGNLVFASFTCPRAERVALAAELEQHCRARRLRGWVINPDQSSKDEVQRGVALSRDFGRVVEAVTGWVDRCQQPERLRGQILQRALEFMRAGG